MTQDADSPKMVRVRALTDLQVDLVAIATGEIAEIRAELVPDLVRVGAVDDEVEAEPAIDPAAEPDPASPPRKKR